MNLINKYVLIVALMAFPALLRAQNKDTLSMSSKIDSIYALQKKTYAEVYDEPLKNRKFGVELNLFRLLYIDEMSTVSGTFSLFNVDRGAEIAFPFYAQFPKTSKDLFSLTLDGHYRYFLGKHQKGFYASAFVRYAHLYGNIGNNNLFDPLVTGQMDSENKIGLGFGFGVRVFSHKHFYWGTSFSFGRYIVGRNDRFAGDLLSLDDDNKVILDIELFKFGWAF